MFGKISQDRIFHFNGSHALGTKPREMLCTVFIGVVTGLQPYSLDFLFVGLGRMLGVLKLYIRVVPAEEVGGTVDLTSITRKLGIDHDGGVIFLHDFLPCVLSLR